MLQDPLETSVHLRRSYLITPLNKYDINFRKFKVAPNAMYRIFLNFAKSCISSSLSKFYNKKKIHRAVFEI